MDGSGGCVLIWAQVFEFWVVDSSGTFGPIALFPQPPFHNNLDPLEVHIYIYII